jgi:hypothetical protein
MGNAPAARNASGMFFRGPAIQAALADHLSAAMFSALLFCPIADECLVPPVFRSTGQVETIACPVLRPQSLRGFRDLRRGDRGASIESRNQML